MDMFGGLTGMKATAMNLEYFTDLLEIKHINLRIQYHYQSM